MTRLILTSLAWLLLVSTVAAQAKVTVGDFTGRRASKVRAQVVKALDGEVELVPNSDVESAAESLGVDASTAEGRTAVALELGISAFVAGSVKKKGKRSTLTLTVYDASDGGEVGTGTVRGKTKALPKLAKRKAWGEIGSLIAGTSVPEPEAEPEPEPEPEEEPREYTAGDADDEDQDEDEDPGEAEGPGLVVSVGLGLGTRDFDYPKDGNLGGLPNYTLTPWGDDAGVAPAALLGLQLFPMAFVGGGLASNIGVDVRAELVFGVDSVDPVRDETYATNALRWSADLMMRFPMDGLEPAVRLGYGVSTYEIESSPTQRSPVPAVAYGSVRFGGDLRLGLGDSLALDTHLVLLLPLGFGELGEDDWFPGASALGLESELRVAILLSESLETFVGLGYDRYGLTLDPDPADEGVGLGRVAGGAVDQYMHVRLGVGYRI